MQSFQRVFQRPNVPFVREKRESDFSLSDIAIPSLAFLLSRFLLIWVNQAEFTDGYQLLTWSFDHPVRWHPLYPLMIKGTGWMFDPVLAGRVVSIVSGFGAMIALNRIANLLYGRRAAILVCWLYVASPLFYWANLRVLAESTFQFLCCWSIYFFLKTFKEEEPAAGSAFVLMSGLAYLTRPEAVLFLPPIAAVLWKFAFRRIVLYAAALIPWMLGFVWSFAVQSSDRYTDIVVSSLPQFQWDLAMVRLITYIEVYPYVLFYPVFAFALLNLLRIPMDALWKKSFIYIHLFFGVMLFVHPAWTTRLLFLPLSLLVVEASAGILQVNRRVQYVTIATCFIFALAAVILQREMFSDFKEASLAAKGKFDEKRVLSDEIAKTGFYLARSVDVYDRQDLKPGDILILHSYNTNLDREKLFLDSNYVYKSLYEAHASTVPLLANTALADIDQTNSVLALIQRFQRQRFQAVVIQVDSQRRPH